MKKQLFSIIILAIFITASSALAVAQNIPENKELDIFYMYSNEDGMYFLEPTAEYENVIYVDYASWNEWIGLDSTTLHHGTKFIGVFDSEGWELYDIKPKDENAAK